MISISCRRCSRNSKSGSRTPSICRKSRKALRRRPFFLKTMTVATPQKENEVYRDTDLYITYLPKKQEKSTAIYAVLFAAENLFRDGLKVGNRYLPVVSMSEELMGTDNDGGRLTLTFQYYDAREKEETAEIMKVLHQRYQGKET